MIQEYADAILKTLDGQWCHGTPAGGYPGSCCLGMAVSDSTGGNQAQVMAEVEQQVKSLFPDRVSASRPLLPMFNCCNSRVIPAFNNHPDTSLADIRLVVTSAVTRQ